MYNAGLSVCSKPKQGVPVWLRKDENIWVRLIFEIEKIMFSYDEWISKSTYIVYKTYLIQLSMSGLLKPKQLDYQHTDVGHLWVRFVFKKWQGMISLMNKADAKAVLFSGVWFYCISERFEKMTL